MAWIKTNENASGVLDQHQTNGVSCISSSRVTWRNLDSLSMNQRPQLNHNDSNTSSDGCPQFAL